MKAICFYFQIHQPFRLKRYRFFDIGNDHYYYDDFANDDIITRIARNSYIPAAESLLRMIEQTKGAFRCAISVTGVALEQIEQYVPEFLDLLKKLADTGKVEFLAETYDHSLASLADPEEFRLQVQLHTDKIKELFGQTPKVFRNSELIYSDEIAPQILAMGFKGCITEGAKHILGWKSPDYVYSSASAPKLKLLLKNDKLSDDISSRFSDTGWNEYPLTADKYIGWIADTPQEEQVFNLFMNLETFGEFQRRETGIFQFLEALPRFAAERGVHFMTPSEAVKTFKAVGELSVPFPMSWADEARDTSAWLGNKLQNEAFSKLYSIAERVRLCDNRQLKQDWGAPAGVRPPVLHVDETFRRRVVTCRLLPLRNPVPGIHQLYECAGRLHRQGRGAVPHEHRGRGAKLAADHHPQPGPRNRDPQQRGGHLPPQRGTSQRGASPARESRRRNPKEDRQERNQGDKRGQAQGIPQDCQAESPKE